MPLHDVVSISGLETECVVGVYPRERGRPQPLRVDLELTLNTDSAGKSGRLSRTVDYDATASAVVFLLQSCRFGLLETAARAIATFLLAPPAPGERRAPIQTTRVTLIKPQALPGNAVASLSIERDASWAAIRHESASYGSVDVIHASPEAGIYRLNLGPRQEARLDDHDAELVLTSGLIGDGAPLLACTRRALRRGALRTVTNPTRRWQSLLCVSSPLARAEAVRAESRRSSV